MNEMTRLVQIRLEATHTEAASAGVVYSRRSTLYCEVRATKTTGSPITIIFRWNTWSNKPTRVDSNGVVSISLHKLAQDAAWKKFDEYRGKSTWPG